MIDRTHYTYVFIHIQKIKFYIFTSQKKWSIMGGTSMTLFRLHSDIYFLCDPGQVPQPLWTSAFVCSVGITTHRVWFCIGSWFGQTSFNVYLGLAGKKGRVQWDCKMKHTDCKMQAIECMYNLILVKTYVDLLISISTHVSKITCVFFIF